jgi:isopenicillin-N N-acyltransferase like protein
MIDDTKGSGFNIDVLDLSGDPVDIGRGMGKALRATRDRLKQFRLLVKKEAQEVRRLSSYNEKALLQFRELLEAEAEDIDQWLNAMADELSIDERDLFLWGSGAFFRDLMHCISKEGCSTFALARSSEGAILGKNRDADSKYGPWQGMIRVRPESGYAYVAMTTYGVPGVNSSGMNERGLAVADTHVVSEDIGVGLPRYALEHEILKKCCTVEEALALVLARPRMGRGNLILADKGGNLGVAELGNHMCAVRSSRGGFLVNTNHFSDPVLQNTFVEANQPNLRACSMRRYRQLTRFLTQGVSGLNDAKIMLSYHGDNLDSLCRHDSIDPPKRTISTVFYMPNLAKAFFTGNYPCMADYQEIACEYS